MADDRTRDLADRYLAAQLAGDRREALRLVLDEGLAAGIAVPVLELDVIRAAQREVGRLWEENRISVAQEHVATAISQLVLAHLYRDLPRAAARGRSVAVACVEGELHDLGARMVADFLEMDGYDVDFLGANVPSESLVAHVRERRPDLVALSATMAHHLPALQTVLGRLCDTMGGDYPVAVGGGALAAGGAPAAEGRVLRCGDVHDLIDGAPGLLAAAAGDLEAAAG